jgi:soluble lytic murein transglycosylase-like protein
LLLTGDMKRMPTLLICTVGLLSLSGTFPERTPAPSGLQAPGPALPPPAKKEAESNRGSQRSLALVQVREALRHSRRDHWTEDEILGLAQTIVVESHRHGFDPALVMAIIHVESSGNPNAVSHVGARGLMQLMPSTAQEIAGKLELAWEGPDSLFDPVVNVTLGIAYLRHLNDRFENIPMALAAYNWGPSRIHRRIRRGDSLPVRYVDKVKQVYGGDLALRSQRG